MSFRSLIPLVAERITQTEFCFFTINYYYYFFCVFSLLLLSVGLDINRADAFAEVFNVSQNTIRFHSRSWWREHIRSPNRPAYGVWQNHKAGELVIGSLALGTPFLSVPMRRSLFTQARLLPSSRCAKLILSEALTLSWATMSGGAAEKGGSLGSPHPSHCLESAHH